MVWDEYVRIQTRPKGWSLQVHRLEGEGRDFLASILVEMLSYAKYVVLVDWLLAHHSILCDWPPETKH